MRQLGRRHIDVLRPEKIKNLADVQVVCFDKTGTLTGSVVRTPMLPYTRYFLILCELVLA